MGIFFSPFFARVSFATSVFLKEAFLNREKYDEYESNLPEGYTEYIIDGGCHAGFGMYGAQKGDGKPSLASEEQIRITTEELYKFVTN